MWALCSHVFCMLINVTSAAEEWLEMVRFANCVGALTCMKHGAIDAIPSLDEVMEKLNESLK